MANTLTGKEYSVFRGVSGKLSATKQTIPELGPKDVLIKITHSGVCHTDLLYFNFGAPVALGHEGVGIVQAVGTAVTQFKIGDRAGTGFARDSCGSCGYCLHGDDIWCYDRVVMGEGDYDNGSFGEYYIGKETYVHRIPDGLASEHAAPLNCAGATVYSALIKNTKVGDRVGVVGLGGLGHLALQFAAKLGAEVVALSTTESKKEESIGFGATEFLTLDKLESVTKPINVLIIAGSHYPDWDRVFKKEFLARNGKVVILSASRGQKLDVAADALFWNGYTVDHSLVASRADHDDMLNFAAQQGIKPAVQIYKHNGVESIEKAFEDIHNNKVRYRAVLEY
ncbi:hypothetical protein ABW20_dc0107775 [Dactylellina cionopaga]|nr:hypothetical protein ABW20_dc0107775 [Dactylellina cionopaga]